MGIVVNSYFSGAGLFDIGLSLGGLEVNQSFELDPVCCETQRLNFSHAVRECDISNKLVLDESGCDVMVGTYPCTKYSTAADIHGTRTGDELFLHFFRHIAIKKPEVYVIENVPGMKKFPVVMEAMTKLPDYYVSVFCPVKAETWLPQRRDRLIIIGSKKVFNWREPEQGKRLSLKDVIESNPEIEVPEYVYKRLKGGYRDLPIISDPEKDDIAPTCMAHYAKDKGTRLVRDRAFPGEYRPYTVKEFARLQGVPDSYKFSGTDNQKYKMIGNGVAVPVGEWVAGEIRRYFN
ncbi:MAG: DNA (cytosine-5-)-methyltransferase [Spirochaetae bacterium HGW-Spirochaetae-5]|nr:MAG: DNA (cytosine-5-)-methyltransferase [Spirochaetae bacterium HGW-Spirochaetae-5]